jgi:hypothetical protein
MISVIARDPSGNQIAEFDVVVELPNSILLSVSVTGYAPYVNQPYKNLDLNSTIPITLTPTIAAMPPLQPVIPPAVTGLAPFTIGMTDDQVRALVNQYIAAGNVQNTDNGQYWVDAWSAWGSPDPAYFTTKLETGISEQPGYNGYFGVIH